MDIRTKLAIILISVSLGSMWLLGFFAYQNSASMLQEISERQLNALAESKAQDLQNVIESWSDRTRLVSSRTQLRLSLDQYNQGNTNTLPQMTRILNDAQSATPSVVAITLYDIAGNRISSAGNIERIIDSGEGIVADTAYIGVLSEGGADWVTFESPLQLEQAVIGKLRVAFTADDLLTVSEDYTGLGEYGETIIAHENNDGEIEVLHDLRHASVDEIDPDSLAGFISDSVDGEQEIYTEGQTSYRNTPAWAATRFLEEVEWGLTVQLDEAEERIPLLELRDSMIDLGLSLSAFAIFGGTLLGFYLARPLHGLAEVVDRIRKGETELRAEVVSEDEIGHLASAINELLDDRESDTSDST